MRQDHNVLIVGAGPTGLAMAIELKRLGMPVRLIDKAEAPAQYSRALVVQARTLEQFERYGIADEAVARGRKMHGASLFSEGKQIVSFKLDEIPGRYPFALFLPQSETERLLTERLLSLGGEIERGTELLSYKNGKDGIEAQLRHKAGTVQTVPARWLVGCDGAHSLVRQQSKISFKGDTSGLDFFLGDLELNGPDAPGDEISLHLHRGNVVFFGRLDDKLVRVIVIMQRAADTPPLTRQPTIADFQAAIDGAGAKVTVTSAAWMTPFHINQRKAERYRIDSAFLAGDASHIHSPVGGQGMNTGIQDAANLAWKLAAVADGAGTELLDTYDEERGKVGEELLKTTSLGLLLATSANPIIEIVRDLLAPALTSLEPVKHAMMGFVSETAIHYRGSSIAADYGGDGELRAGDRVPNPDVEYEGGKRGRLLDDLADGRALAMGIGIEDMRKIRARVPRANFLELRSAEGMLGTEIEVPPEEANGEKAGYHPVQDEFPASRPSGRAVAHSEIGLLTPEIEKLSGSENRVVVIRPDGYVGFRGSIDDLARLDDYARLTGLV
jgi:3-(3-hydroxy-phenyl)propionate hydroxylase